MASSGAAQSMTSPPGASQVADALQPVGRSAIRAPHVGNSYGSTVTIAATMEFQSTLPARGAMRDPQEGVTVIVFQSTLPVGERR